MTALFKRDAGPWVARCVLMAVTARRDQHVSGFLHARRYIALATCILALVWYAYNLWKATTGWEEVYVVAVECERREGGPTRREGGVHGHRQRRA